MHGRRLAIRVRGNELPLTQLRTRYLRQTVARAKFAMRSELRFVMHPEDEEALVRELLLDPSIRFVNGPRETMLSAATPRLLGVFTARKARARAFDSDLQRHRTLFRAATSRCVIGAAFVTLFVRSLHDPIAAARPKLAPGCAVSVATV